LALPSYIREKYITNIVRAKEIRGTMAFIQIKLDCEYKDDVYRIRIIGPLNTNKIDRLGKRTKLSRIEKTRC